MDKISRRLFLKGGVAGLTALALGSETALAARTEVPGKALDGRLVKAGKFDVIICGGGPAGFVAAVAAAREGAKVALVER